MSVEFFELGNEESLKRMSLVGVARGAVASDLVRDRIEITSPGLRHHVLDGSSYCSGT
jgi:hypothetical protein